MRFYTKQHPFYCGIDLHARTMDLCILSQDGEVRLYRNRQARPDAVLKAIAPYRNDMVIAGACIFTGYWLADLCAQEGLPFVLGHALSMKALHGGQTINDKLDSQKIAVRLRGGLLPQAYVYPAAMRATRDLLRRRTHLMRKRAELLTHIQQTNSQYNLPAFDRAIIHAANRVGVTAHFSDPSVRKSIDVDVALLDRYDTLLSDLERTLVHSAKRHDPEAFHRLHSIPGIGHVLAMTILYEIHDVTRF